MTLIELESPKQSIQDMVSGVPFPIPCPTGRVLYFRHPTPAERGQATLEQRIARRYLLRNDERVKALSKLPADDDELKPFHLFMDQMKSEMENADSPDEVTFWTNRINAVYRMIENRTAADDILDAHARDARNLWLARTLLMDVPFDSLIPNEQDAVLEAAEDFFNELNALPFGFSLEARLQDSDTA